MGVLFYSLLLSMVYVACGLNHKTAPLSVREKVILLENDQSSFLKHLIQLPTVNEAVVLSTCNRTEIYCETEDPLQLIPWLAEKHRILPEDLTTYTYIHQGNAGVRHTLRVASGLDSMMLGEPQILGQIKQAYQLACAAGTIKNNLQPIFQYVFSASKRIRHKSGVGKNPISIAYAAAQLVENFFPNLKDLTIFLIGSGETASLVAKYLRKKGVKQFIIASRTHDNAKQLAMNFSGKAVTISDIPQYLSHADVIISATTCPLPFINKGLVEYALTQRHFSPMFFIDLAVPRDIENNIKDFKAIQLYNIDDLQLIVNKGMDERQAASLQAARLIDIELENFTKKHRSRKADKLICDYRRQMHQIGEIELQRAIRKLSSGDCQFNVLKELSERLVNKLTHSPTIGFQNAAKNNQLELLLLAQQLLNQTKNEEIT